MALSIFKTQENMKALEMNKRFRLMMLIVVVTLTVSYNSKAQDARERLYNYAVLQPNHVPKPKVKGWAETRISEKIDRGLVAFKVKDGIYLSWRLLNTDAENVAFDIYEKKDGQQARKINSEPLISTTDFFVDNTDTTSQFYVTAVGTDEPSKAAKVSNLSNKTIPFQGNYMPDRVAVGDLNGDGEYDFVIKQPGGRVDPGVWRKSPDTFKLEAYLSDGTFLWRKDLGWNIEQGIWYSPFVVYDFNGDGKAEVALKSAPTDADYRDEDGRVFDGPEYCSVLDGMTGEEIDRVDWPARNPRFGRYNRNNRNQMGMAYLDGKTPALLVARGTYRLMMVDAYQLNGNKLEKLWRWDGDEENPVIRSQGAHSLHTVDVDKDGRDEIVLGSAVLDDDGTLLFSAGVGHSDKCFITDIDPNRPGMEIFFANEVWHDTAGVSMVDAATGEQIWNINHYTRHVGNGMVADIMPEIPGLECFASEDSKAGLRDKYMLSASGEYLARNLGVPQCTNWIFWDADKLRESIEGSGFGRRSSRGLSIVKYPTDTLTTQIQGAIMMMADIYGDWREELVTVLPGELRIYSTTIPAIDRRTCLMQDPLYRSDVVHRSMGYFQPPVTSYYLGE
ncbi:silent information regulator protein Sir2 [Maribellus sediminis]|uniref:rhamnogalacturonan lyase family protein n=1 Tax=Maribellus sediminis TaxID=2696285 RepID=UPI001981C6FD|nr:silent information regulator protein Sir2 [Maribellus sediminis]